MLFRYYEIGIKVHSTLIPLLHQTEQFTTWLLSHDLKLSHQTTPPFSLNKTWEASEL